MGDNQSPVSINLKFSPVPALEKVDVGSNKEAGECLNDSPVMDDFDYNILPRPKQLLEEAKSGSLGGNKKLSGSKFGGFESSRDSGHVFETDAAAGSADRDDLDNEDIFKESNSDSEDSDEPSYKRHTSASFSFNTMNTFNNPNSLQAKSSWNRPASRTGIVPPSASFCDEKMLKFQEKRKTNNIWTNVLEEERQHQTFTKLGDIDVDGKRVVIERGAETYSFKPGTTSSTRKRKRNISAGSQKKNETNPDDSDISSAGLSDDDMEHIRKSKIEIKACDSISGSGDQLPIRKIQQIAYKKKGHDLSYYIAKELREPKKQLIVRACELLGKQYCIHMFIKTLKIERKGGLPIKNQTRRRTPGGIFFYMIRKDSKFPADQVNAVFQVDTEITINNKKAGKSLLSRDRKGELELRQHQMVKTKGTKPIEEDNKRGKEEAMDEGELAYSDYPEDSSSELNVSLNSNPTFETSVVED